LSLLTPFIISYKSIVKSSSSGNLKLSLFSFPIFKDLKRSIRNLTLGELVLLFIIIALFLILNLLSMYPYTFTPTGQLSLVLPTSLIFWVGINLLGWRRNFKSSTAHLVPQGTPLPLMNFMVLVEVISNIIRPITLSVRLIANIVAGHLLISLLGGLAESSVLMGFSSLLPLFLLRILELSVCFIQAYVFMTLIRLYIKEYTMAAFSRLLLTSTLMLSMNKLSFIYMRFPLLITSLVSYS
jgi:ATP synthase subunit 6